jgi:hypothetical protein
MAQVAKLVIQIPSNTVTKKQNETLNVEINFSYVGPAQRITFTGVVTQQTAWGDFDEIGSTKKAFYTDVPGSDTPKGWLFTVSGLPLAGVEPKTSAYGVKVKAEGTFGTVEAGNKSCLYVQAPAAGISFQVAIWGVPDFGSYQYWWAYYWDPGIGDFVSCGKWYNSYDKIPFSNVQPGGYLAVYLMRDSTVSPQYTSPTFQAVNGGSYTYDVQTGVIYG